MATIEDLNFTSIVDESIDEAIAYWRSKGEPERNPFQGNLNFT